MKSYLENAAAVSEASTVAKAAVDSDTITLLVKYVGNGVLAKTLTKLSNVTLEGHASSASVYRLLLGVNAILTIQYSGNSANTRYAVSARPRAPSQRVLNLTTLTSRC